MATKTVIIHLHSPAFGKRPVTDVDFTYTFQAPVDQALVTAFRDYLTNFRHWTVTGVDIV